MSVFLCCESQKNEKRFHAHRAFMSFIVQSSNVPFFRFYFHSDWRREYFQFLRISLSVERKWEYVILINSLQGDPFNSRKVQLKMRSWNFYIFNLTWEVRNWNRNIASDNSYSFVLEKFCNVSKMRQNEKFSNDSWRQMLKSVWSKKWTGRHQ